MPRASRNYRSLPLFLNCSIFPNYCPYSSYAVTVNCDRYNAYCLYFSWRPGQVSQISIILSRGTPSPRPTPTPAQKHTAAVMSRDKPHKAVSITCQPPALFPAVLFWRLVLRCIGARLTRGKPGRGMAPISECCCCGFLSLF